MPLTSVHEHFENEAWEWKRLLAFFRDENINFKNQLIEILSGETDASLLDAAEFFQEAFVAQDQVLIYLNGELNQYCRLLAGFRKNDDGLPEVEKNHARLQTDIEKENEIFKKLKQEFCQHLAENYARILPGENNTPGNIQ